MTQAVTGLVGTALVALLGFLGVAWGRRIEGKRTSADVVSIEVKTSREVIEMIRVQLAAERARADEMSAELVRMRAEMRTMAENTRHLEAEVARLRGVIEHHGLPIDGA